MRKVSMVVLSAAVALGVSGCDQKKAEPAKPATGAVVGTMPAAKTVMGQPAPAIGAPGALKGKVLEKIDAASYSYLRLQTAQGETWAAVPQTATPVGAEVEIVGGMPMDGFESKSLGRKFDKIVFGNLGGGVGPGATPEQIAAAAKAKGMSPDGMGALPAGHPPIGAAAGEGADAKPDEKVEKASGPDARTVAEIWAQKAALKDAKVTVKAKVVKASNGIMGKNWLHVRDGSGSAATRDNDLVVTTTDTAAAGDVVTVQGAVHVDKDFGAGYRYDVIVEDASVKK